MRITLLAFAIIISAASHVVVAGADVGIVSSEQNIHRGIEFKEFPGLGFIPVFQPSEVLIKIYDFRNGYELKQVLFSNYVMPESHFENNLSVGDIDHNGTPDLQLLVSAGRRRSHI
jgi:hypothetical protein